MDKKEIFITAIKSHEGLIYKVASFYSNDIESRNDLVQEIIYQLWKSFETFNQQSALSTWMYRVAMNTAIHHLNSAKRKVLTVPLGEQLLEIREEEENSGTEEKWQILRQQLNNLNLLDKGIVMLYLENKSYGEIAEITGISISNVGTKLLRIKEKLRKQISKQL